MATVIEILELSGVPTLCASKATREEAHLKVGEVIANALQVLSALVKTSSLSLFSLVDATQEEAPLKGKSWPRLCRCCPPLCPSNLLK